MIIVSACLLGEKCKYNGGDNLCPFLKESLSFPLLPLCPEVLGELPVPRPPAEIVGGNGYDVLEGRARVINIEGQDVTSAFLRGARETLRQAQEHKAHLAILKEKSPSCGCRYIYDGTFTNTLRPGPG